MAKRGKVGCGGREIMAALWGSRGRPETNQWTDLCTERARSHALVISSLHIAKTYVPEQGSGKLVSVDEYHATPRRVESPRTSAKWSEARARHRKNAEEN